MLRTYLISLTAAAGLLALGITTASGASAQGVGGVHPPAGVVSAVPVATTPHLKATNDNPTQQVRQLVQCGSTMYAVGTFNQILKGSTTYTRSNIVSFAAAAPYTVTSWAPSVNGEINSITFSGGNCANAYIGGSFSSVNGTSVQNIAEISTSTGNVVTAFGHSAGSEVETLLGVDGHILAGGYFKSINGSTADRFLASLNPTTGADDGYLKLNISGNYNFPGVAGNGTRVYNQSLSHGGQLDLVMGDFTSVGGLGRQQIFMLNLATSPATVTGWSSPQFDGSQGEATPSDPTHGYPYECATVEPYYVKAAGWSPNDSEVYIGTTGYHPNGWPVGQTPRNGLCDVAAAFPATQTEVLANWINYTGCDSLYAVSADNNAAYFAGHERYSMNSNDCDALGPGGYNAPGLEGLQPSTGDLYVNSGGTAGYYSRDRGLGADDMLLTGAGLWIASDNLDGSQMCGGVQNLSGICFLPYS